MKPKTKIPKSSPMTVIKNPKYLNTTVFEKREAEMKKVQENNFLRTLPQIRSQTQTDYMNTESKTLYLNKTRTAWSKNPKSVYLTDCTLSTANQTETEKIKKNSDSDLIKEEYYGTGLLTYLYNKEKYFPRERKIKSRDGKLLNRKNKAILSKKEGVKDYIYKTRDIVALKYNLDIKKERAIRLEETYNNEIESISDTINSLKDAKKLFTEEFYAKFTEYVKYLVKQKDMEATVCSVLESEELQLRKQIYNLEQKKTKINNSIQNYILKWFFLMIQVNEEKKDLTPTFISLFTKEHPTEEEKKIINSYKSELMFKTPEDFMIKFDRIENASMEHMINLNREKIETKKMKDRVLKLRAEKAEEQKIAMDIKIKKQNQLQQLKEKNESLKIEKQKLIAMKENIKRKVMFKETLSRRNKANSSILTIRLFEAVDSVFKSAYLFNKKINKEISFKQLREEDIIPKLTHTEVTLDLLDVALKNQRLVIANFDEIIKKKRGTIEKEHKQEKAEKQRMEEKRNQDLLNQEVQERANKVYYLPKKKVNDYLDHINKKKSNQESKAKVKELSFLDFMYDLDNFD